MRKSKPVIEKRKHLAWYLAVKMAPREVTRAKYSITGLDTKRGVIFILERSSMAFNIQKWSDDMSFARYKDLMQGKTELEGQALLEQAGQSRAVWSALKSASYVAVAVYGMMIAHVRAGNITGDALWAVWLVLFFAALCLHSQAKSKQEEYTHIFFAFHTYIKKQERSK